MMINEAGTLDGKDIEALHVMRVSCRRLRVAINVFKQFLDPPIPQDIHIALRRTGKVLGEIRDFDVLIEHIEIDLVPVQPEGQFILNAFLKYCQKEREYLRKGLPVYFSGAEYLDVKKFFYDYCKKIISTSQLCYEIPELKYFAAAALSKKRSKIPRFDELPVTPVVKQLHQLRIAIKKLRYTSEFFMVIYGDSLGDLIAEYKLLQDHLGAIHDNDFLLEQARKFIHGGVFNLKNSESSMDSSTTQFLSFIQNEERLQREMCDAFYSLYKSANLTHI